MHILVTGGLGRMGQTVVAYLQQKGHQVRAIDMIAAVDFAVETAVNWGDVEYQQVDIRDYQAVVRCCQHVDAIVHLAGIPIYTAERSAEIFAINAGGTFNIYQAAANSGVKRIVSASSINYLGNGFGTNYLDIQYFPVDETHPNITIDTYAFSKQMLEEIAAYFWRKDKLTSINFRFPLIYSRHWLTPELTRQMWQKNQADFDRLMQLSEQERQLEAQKLKERYLDLRTQRVEGKVAYDAIFHFFFTEPGAMLMFGIDNFWSVLNDWDAARAIELALTTEISGNHSLFIGETNNSTGLPSRQLAELFYPEVQEWKRPCSGTSSLLDINKVKEMLGFVPSVDINETSVL